MIGLYLDLLPHAARRRIVTARRWTTRAYADACGGHCLLGHAENWGWDGRRPSANEVNFETFSLRRRAGNDPWNHPPLLAHRFDRLCERYGTDRVAGWIRARAERKEWESGRVGDRARIAAAERATASQRTSRPRPRTGPASACAPRGGPPGPGTRSVRTVGHARAPSEP